MKPKPLDLEKFSLFEILHRKGLTGFGGTIKNFGKLGGWVLIDELLRKEIRQRIKSAVQGLLNEIEEDIKYWEKEMDKYEDKLLNAKSKEERRIYDRAWKIAGEVHRILDVRVKELIKYYFKDVLKGDSDEEE